MYLTSFVNTRIGVELAAVQKKLHDCVVVEFQLYSARTFHVTLSPQIYKGGQGPPPNNHQHLRQYKPHRTGIYFYFVFSIFLESIGGLPELKKKISLSWIAIAIPF